MNSRKCQASRPQRIQRTLCFAVTSVKKSQQNAPKSPVSQIWFWAHCGVNYMGPAYCEQFQRHLTAPSRHSIVVLGEPSVEFRIVFSPPTPQSADFHLCLGHGSRRKILCRLDGPIRANRFADSRESPDSRESSQGS